MKLHRGGKSDSCGKYVQTDQQKPSQYIETWKPGSMIIMDGTKDKSSWGQTAIGITIDEDDVIALWRKLIEHYGQEIKRLKNKVKDLEEKT